MPSKNLTPEQEVQLLKAENAKLRSRNADLYRDCVAFAKLIKAGAKKEEQIDELQKEIIMLRSKVDKMNQTSYPKIDFDDISSNRFSSNNFEDISSNTFSNDEDSADEIMLDDAEDTTDDITSDDTVTYNPRIHYIDQETFEQQNGDTFDSIAGTKAKKEKKKSTKKSGQYKVPRILVSVLLAFSVFINIISGISYLFSTAYKDYTVMGYRFAAVQNNAMMPEINTSDVVLIKYCNFEGLAIDSLVVTTKDTQSLARITDLAVSDGVAVATVQDKKGTYEIGANEFVGKVTMTLPVLGSIVHYASANSYNYMAITVSVTIFLVACLLLIPHNKPKKAKFGKDYTAEEFII